MHNQNPEILADRAAGCPRQKRRTWLVAGVVTTLSLTVVAATAVAPATTTVPRDTVIEALGAPVYRVLSAEPQPFVQEDRVRRGDTLSSIFDRLGIDDPTAARFLRTSEEGRRAISQLRAGKRVSATTTPEGKLIDLSLPLTGGAGYFSISRNDDDFAVHDDSNSAVTAIVEMRSGTIKHSLFGATDAAGVPDAITTRLADLFGTEIDFHTDLRTGDRFSVVYETLLKEDGRAQGVGRILAAEFINKGRRHSVVLYKDSEGRADYYSDDGRSLKQAFLRSPLEFTRVTSGFSRRFHPILKKWRQHKGVDFGAPSGAAVKATSNGTVEFAGKQRGYGNVVILRHRDKVTTLYAHLRGFASGVRKGTPVSQGDVIGYVGQTGWATGPHLHYEFKVSNVPKDPMAVVLPAARPLTAKELGRFKQMSAPYRTRIALLNRRPDTIQGSTP